MNKYQVLDYIVECEYELSEYLPVVNSSGKNSATGTANFQLTGENIHELLCVNLPQALADQGEVVLHASSYLEDEKLVAFTGLSGAGKSTRALSAATTQVAGDEALVLRGAEGKILGMTYSHPLRAWNNGLKRVIKPSVGTCAELAKLNLLVHDKALQTRSPFEHFLQSVYSPSDSTKTQTLALHVLSIYEQLVRQKLIETLTYNH